MRGLAFWLFCSKIYNRNQVLRHLWVWGSPRGPRSTKLKMVQIRLDTEHPPPASFSFSTTQMRSTLCSQTSLLWDWAPHISLWPQKALQPLALLQKLCEPALLPPHGSQFSPCFGELIAYVPSCVEEGTWERPYNLQYSVFSQKSGENRAGQRGSPEDKGVSTTTAWTHPQEPCCLTNRWESRQEGGWSKEEGGSC